MKYKKYSINDINNLIENPIFISGSAFNYGQRDNTFVLFDTPTYCTVTKQCKEELVADLRQNMLPSATKRVKYLGVVRIGTNAQSAIRVSNGLHRIEEGMGIPPHKLSLCTTINESFVVWRFELDPEWFISPPVTHLWLRVVRTLFHKGTPQSPFYNWMKEQKPSDIFGKERNVNWGIGKGSGEWPGGHFGDARFSGSSPDTVRGRRGLRILFPNLKEPLVAKRTALRAPKTPLRRACTFCGVSANQKCITYSDNIATRYHRARYSAARKV